MRSLVFLDSLITVLTVSILTLLLSPGSVGLGPARWLCVITPWWLDVRRRLYERGQAISELGWSALGWSVQLGDSPSRDNRIAGNRLVLADRDRPPAIAFPLEGSLARGNRIVGNRLVTEGGDRLPAIAFLLLLAPVLAGCNVASVKGRTADGGEFEASIVSLLTDRHLQRAGDGSLLYTSRPDAALGGQAVAALAALAAPGRLPAKLLAAEPDADAPATAPGLAGPAWPPP